MGRPKKVEQKFEDIVLPIFDQPEAPVVVERSKKQQDDDGKIKYKRIASVKRPHCDVCVNEQRSGKRPDIRQCSYERLHKGVSTFLCYYHTVEARHADGIKTV